MKKASKAMAKPKLKKAQEGTTVGGTKGQGKLGPALGIGIPVAGMAAAGANMIKNAVKRRKERKATEEETKKALDNAKSQRAKKSDVPAPFNKRKLERAKRVVAKTGGVAKYKMGGMKKYQPGGGTGTPFQEYMKTPGAVASDTTFNKENTPRPFSPTKVPSNPALKDAFEKTFGMDVFSRSVPESYYDSAPESNKRQNYDEYHRRMGKGQKAKGGAAKATYKTGGMVNPNAKVSALKKAGSKGVKPNVNPKAAAAKRATGRTGGTSTAPKKALPKAQMGTTVGPRAMQTYTGTNPERPTGTPVQHKTEGQVKKLRGVAKLKANRINKRIKKG